MLLAAALLLAAAHTPVVVGPEIASTPVPFFAGQPAAPAAPLVVDGNGFLMAFTASSGAHAAPSSRASTRRHSRSPAHRARSPSSIRATTR